MSMIAAGNRTSLRKRDDPLLRLYQTTGAATTRMAYDGQSLIAEYDGSNALQRRYVFGPGGDEPLVWYEGSGTATRHFLHADERGSIVALSDSSGAGTNINAYDEYGIPASSNTGRFQYTGQAWFPEVGLYYYRNRIYSPTFGRFMQTDPIGFAGGMNIYGYVFNDPTNLRDPLGLDPPPCSDCGGPPITVTGPGMGSIAWLALVGVAGVHLDEVPSDGGGEGSASQPHPPSRPPTPAPRLTPERRRACATAMAIVSGGITAAILGDFEVAFAALAPPAGRAAALGRAGGGPGMVVGGIIGIIVGAAVLEAHEQSEVVRLCGGQE